MFLLPVLQEICRRGLICAGRDVEWAAIRLPEAVRGHAGLNLFLLWDFLVVAEMKSSIAESTKCLVGRGHDER